SQTVGYAPRGDERTPLPITVALDQKDRSWTGALSSTPVEQTPSGQLVDLGAVATARAEAGSVAVFRRDGRYVDMVTAELAGSYEAPIYGMLTVNSVVEEYDCAPKGLETLAVRLNGQ